MDQMYKSSIAKNKYDHSLMLVSMNKEKRRKKLPDKV